MVNVNCGWLVFQGVQCLGSMGAMSARQAERFMIQYHGAPRGVQAVYSQDVKDEVIEKARELYNGSNLGQIVGPKVWWKRCMQVARQDLNKMDDDWCMQLDAARDAAREGLQ